MENFPPNSTGSKKEPLAPKPRVAQVTSGSAVRRNASLGKRFKHTFFGGDAKTAAEYSWTNVVIPAAQDMLLEAFQSLMERIIYGEARRTRRSPGPMGNLGHVAYNRMSPQQPGRPMAPTMLPRRERARHNFGEIVIESRQEAEEVLERMFDVISKYDSATVADLYELTGLQSSHVDHKWGWTELHGSHVGRIRGGGYLLELPDPEPLG